MKEELTGKERQLRQVPEDFDRCHPADTQCAERQELKHEACEVLDQERLDREKEFCYKHPGCDFAETCVEIARDRAEERVTECTKSKA